MSWFLFKKGHPLNEPSAPTHLTSSRSLELGVFWPAGSFYSLRPRSCGLWPLYRDNTLDLLESSATWLKPDVQEDSPDTRDSTDEKIGLLRCVAKMSPDKSQNQRASHREREYHRSPDAVLPRPRLSDYKVSMPVIEVY
ncbi:Uncharacterized protein Fot_23447 [Forsythia ovata]|uniref:Uncharacterized protein n=1 Tax=Forsythia ovata TaxID=205694 RepID=A0ABD1V0K6_9LAMI